MRNKSDQWVRPFLKENRIGIFWTVLFSFLMIFSSMALMFTSGYLITRAAQHPSNIMLIYVPIVLTRAFGIGRPTFKYAQRLTSHNWVLKIVSLTREKLFKTVDANSTIVAGSHSTGEVISLLSNDIDQLQNLYLRTIFPIASGILLYVFVTLFTAAFSLAFCLFWFIALMIIAICFPYFSWKMNRDRIIQQKKLADKSIDLATDAVLGAFDWQLSGQQRKFTDRKSKLSKQLAKVKSGGRRFGWVRDFLIECLLMATVVVTLLWSYQQFFGHTVGIDLIAAFVLAIFPMSEALTDLNRGASEATYYKDSIERLNSLGPIKKQTISQLQENLHPDIKIDNLSFAYDSKKEVLKGINMNIPFGSKVAILGRSGVGKSTLLKLITGDLKSDRGSLEISGVEKSQIKNSQNQIFSILDQNPYLFDMTIANNLRLVDPKADNDRLMEVLKEVGLGKLLANLPDGLDTPMREAGSRFSGGEQQRLSLARILLRDTPIVILDEPTVSLDPLTERQVMQTIFRVLKNKSLIWVTHHLIGLENVDRLYFIENGKTKFSGTPVQSKQDPFLKKLWQLDEI
ncbi:thiol reductant ABC exporter subunit CydC [Oenococcus oeni]|nr:thiol reductant ABC exporter subunit CydC [Oenococcus oeni]TEU59436.1 thiol reductant ABC exporter subunit CydC [Oenococcus oeni]TEU61238.1 thiol reductant ABC exporter subunit CydC [Oenococcus oeni]